MFIKTRKTLFWALLLQKPQNKIVLKNPAKSFFNLDNTLTSCKKI